MQSFKSSYITPDFFDHLVIGYALDHRGLHGRSHWLRVLENGRMLAAAEDANLKVVELFAVIHDSKRENEDWDEDHGARAAKHARMLRGTWFDLTDPEMALLEYACEHHSNGLLDADITVQCCWDADRLDLGRVGIYPESRRLCTDTARSPFVIDFAYQNSLGSIATSLS